MDGNTTSVKVVANFSRVTDEPPVLPPRDHIKAKSKHPVPPLKSETKIASKAFVTTPLKIENTEYGKPTEKHYMELFPRLPSLPEGDSTEKSNTYQSLNLRAKRNKPDPPKRQERYNNRTASGGNQEIGETFEEINTTNA